MRGVKLVDILNYLVEEYGWERLAEEIDIRCFKIRPTIKSSLRFIRNTAWVIDRVEELYVQSILEDQQRQEEDSAAQGE